MEWLHKILKGTENADELVSAICAELPKNFIPKDKYNQLAEEKRQFLSQQKTDVDSAVKNAVINFALSSLAKKAEIKDGDIVKMLIDNGKVTINETGEICGLLEQIESIKGEKPYLFADQLLNGRSPVMGSGTPSGITKDRFSQMGYKERLELYNSNPELYETLSN